MALGKNLATVPFVSITLFRLHLYMYCALQYFKYIKKNIDVNYFEGTKRDKIKIE